MTKIWIFAVCRNEEAIIPWWLRHYAQFADRILVWDDASNDDSRTLLRAHPLVTLFDWPHAPGIHEDIFLHHAYDVYPSARGKADWVMWVDMDEFIWHPNIQEFFADKQNYGYAVSGTGVRSLNPLEYTDVIRTQGYNMVGDGLPVSGYEHKQIWEHLPMGVKAPIYSKPVIFRPELKVRWTRGKHDLENCSATPSERPLLKLLHYRYLGADYTRAKNARNYERVGSDKGLAWSCAPDYDGKDKEGSPQWSEFAKTVAFNVVDAPI